MRLFPCAGLAATLVLLPLSSLWPEAPAPFPVLSGGTAWAQGAPPPDHATAPPARKGRKQRGAPARGPRGRHRRREGAESGGGPPPPSTSRTTSPRPTSPSGRPRRHVRPVVRRRPPRPTTAHRQRHLRRRQHRRPVREIRT